MLYCCYFIYFCVSFPLPGPCTRGRTCSSAWTSTRCRTWPTSSPGRSGKNWRRKIFHPWHAVTCSSHCTGNEINFPAFTVLPVIPISHIFFSFSTCMGRFFSFHRVVYRFQNIQFCSRLIWPYIIFKIEIDISVLISLKKYWVSLIISSIFWSNVSQFGLKLVCPEFLWNQFVLTSCQLNVFLAHKLVKITANFLALFPSLSFSPSPSGPSSAPPWRPASATSTRAWCAPGEASSARCAAGPSPSSPSTWRTSRSARSASRSST